MDDAWITCPSCSAEIGADENGHWPARCPKCGEMVVVDDAETAEQVEPAQPAMEEIEEAKIRRIVRERRALVRARTYYIVVMAACLVLAVQVTIRCIGVIRAGDSGVLAIGWGAGGVLLLWFAAKAPARIRELSKVINTSELVKPAGPPDFSGLSDGSQHARNLDEFGK